MRGRPWAQKLKLGGETASSLPQYGPWPLAHCVHSKCQRSDQQCALQLLHKVKPGTPAASARGVPILKEIPIDALSFGTAKHKQGHGLRPRQRLRHRVRLAGRSERETCHKVLWVFFWGEKNSCPGSCAKLFQCKTIFLGGTFFGGNIFKANPLKPQLFAMGQWAKRECVVILQSL